MTTIDLLKKTKASWGSIRSADAEEKNRLLLAMAESLEANCADILRENSEDLDAARGHISEVMLDRLALTEARIRAMADGIREAAALPDHVGRTLAQFVRPNGMTITKRQVPLGLVAIIYDYNPTQHLRKESTRLQVVYFHHFLGDFIRIYVILIVDTRNVI